MAEALGTPRPLDTQAISAIQLARGRERAG
jgi:hypothetical protein